jgi:glycosyltransferase involved in cell wall biosynthesis
MIVVSFSLDSSLAQARLQGNLQAHGERERLFKTFDRVVLLTQDTQRFGDELAGITHVPCAYSRFEIVRTVLSHFKFLRWLYFSLSSFLWLLRNRREINVVISRNADSPTPVLFSSLFGIPYFIHYHYDVATQIRKINKRAFEGMLLLFLEKICFKKAACVWVMAANLGEKAEALGARKVTLIPNWVDFKEKPKSRRKEFAEPIILFVGRLHPVKRAHLLIEAFSQLGEVYPHATLYIIGDGKELRHLVALAKKLKLDKHVQFLGFQSHEKVFDMMRQSDMIVLPSKMEGSPRVLIEAMMLKVPIVATNVPGIRDVLRHSETGHLLARATPEDLAAAMDYVIRNKKYAVKIAENAYKFAKQQFSKEHVLKKIRDDLFSSVPNYRQNTSLSG